MKNVSASVRARLLNLSRAKGLPLDALVEQYATGRFLYRLAQSEYRERFVLKGKLSHLALSVIIEDVAAFLLPADRNEVYKEIFVRVEYFEKYQVKM